MFVVDDDPGHVGVGRVQFFSGECHLVHDLVSFASSGAAVDGVPVQTVLAGASLPLRREIRGIVFEAEREGEALRVVVEFSDGAGFEEVALALSDAVLAGEGPA